MYKLLSSVITPLDSVHNCTVHHCVLNNTVDSKNVHPGHLQPMGEQLPKINITKTPYIDSLTFYEYYYKPKKPYFSINSLKIPKVYSDDKLLEEAAGGWKVIIEPQNRIVHSHREPFYVANFSSFLNGYKKSEMYHISPNIPNALRLRPPDLLNCELLSKSIGEHRMWMSNGNTSSSLHFDTHDVIVQQVYGFKEVFLWPPEVGRNVYMDFHDRYGISPVNVDKVDYLRFPEFFKVSPSMVTLNPGDLLYIPTLWWHQLRSPVVGKNIMYTIEFEHKLNIIPIRVTTSSESYMNAWEQTLKRVPFSCDGIKYQRVSMRNKKDEDNKNISNENIKGDVNTLDNCFDFCIDSYCHELNGDYTYECGACDLSAKCNPSVFDHTTVAETSNLEI